MCQGLAFIRQDVTLIRQGLIFMRQGLTHRLRSFRLLVWLERSDRVMMLARGLSLSWEILKRERLEAYKR